MRFGGWKKNNTGFSAVKGAVSNRDLLWLFALISVGFLLRYAAIDRWPLWGDEALTLTLAERSVFELIFIPVDPSPALYYLLHKLLIPIDATVAWVRSISLVAGTLAIPAIYAAGRLAFGRREALVAAALVTISPPLIDYSQEARAYSLLVLLVLVSAAGLLWWGRELGRENPRRASLWLFGLGSVLAFYTHIVSIFWIGPALLVMIGLTHRKGTALARRLSRITALAMMLGALPEIFRLSLRLWIGGTNFWIEQPSVGEFLILLGDNFLPSGLWRNAFIDAPAGLSAMLLVLSAVLVAALLLARRDSLSSWAVQNPLGPAVLLILMTAPLFIWLFGFIVQPILMQRTMLIGVPGFLLLLARADRFANGWIAIAAISGSAGALIATGTVREKEDWRTAFAVLQLEVRPGDGLVMCTTWKWPAFRHAVSAPLPMPVYLPLRDGTLVQAESVLGTNPHWPEDAKAFRNRDRVTASPPKRLWWIRSECDEDEIDVVQRWAATSSWRRQLLLASDDPLKRIELLVAEPALKPANVKVGSGGGT